MVGTRSVRVDSYDDDWRWKVGPIFFGGSPYIRHGCRSGF